MTKEISLKLDHGYEAFFNTVRSRLSDTQLRLAQTVNNEVIKFYWQLGKDILEIQATNATWGSRLLDQLSKDLQAHSPGMSGFPRRSLAYMRLLATIYPNEDQFVQQAAAHRARSSKLY